MTARQSLLDNYHPARKHHSCSHCAAPQHALGAAMAAFVIQGMQVDSGRCVPPQNWTRNISRPIALRDRWQAKRPRWTGAFHDMGCEGVYEGVLRTISGAIRASWSPGS